MTFKTYPDKAAFDADYRLGAEPEGHPNTRPGVKLHYNRFVMLPICRNRAAGIHRVMEWLGTERIVVAGSGFGWLVEAFISDHGYSNIVGCDTSPYIQNNKLTSELTDVRDAITAAGLDPDAETEMVTRLLDGGVRVGVTILDEDMQSNRSRNAVRSYLGDVPQIILTEDVLPALFDAEATQLSVDYRTYSPVPQIVHYVTTTRPGQTPGEFNWKTLSEWKTLLPNDVFIEAGTYQVL